MNTYERKKRQSELEQVNKRQRPGKDRGVELDLFQMKTFEYLLQDPETPWVENFIALVKAGKRQESFSADRFNQAMEGMVIPAGVADQIKRVFGRDDIRFTDEGRGTRKNQPFNLETITDQLQCTPEQAATVLAFSILLEDKYHIVGALKHPEIQAQFGVQFDEAKVRAFFKSEEFLNAATNKTLERSLPLLAKEAGIKGVQHIIHYLRVFEFKPNIEHLRKAFGTQQRREQFKNLLSADVKEGLDLLLDYEFLFGELTQDEFLQLFPNWQEAESFRTYRYERKFNLKRPVPVRTPTPEPTPASSVQPLVVEPPKVIIPPKPSELKQLMRWGAVALGFASVGTVSVGAVAWEVSNRFATEEPTTEEGEAEQAYVAKQSIEQAKSIESNNFSPEGTEFENGDNFVAVPELHSMRATAVFTTLEPNGVLSYQPEFAFSLDPKELNDDNSREHVVAERFFAQAAVLYPPELGSIDPSSIMVPGHTAEEFTVAVGEQGRFQVALVESSNKPLEVVYTVRVAYGAANIEYTGELPPIPKIENLGKLDRAEELSLKRRASESDLAFALRAENAIQAIYHYPKSAREKGLPFDQARQELIGDCDVANQDFLEILQSQGVHAEMVVDTHPVPGRENHGQIRAVTYSEITYGYVVTELDATPGLYTQEGKTAVEKGTTQTQPIPEVEESAAQQALKKLIGEYIQKQEAEVAPSSKTAPSPDVEQPSLRPRPIEAREWKALGGGVYGYAEYVLKHSFSSPQDKQAREKLTGELAEIMLKELQRSQVIPEGKNPYEWARDIDPGEAESMLKAMDASPLIRTLVEQLPKYERRNE